MKKGYVLFIASALVIAFNSCSSKAKRALEYHDKMLHIVQAVIDSSLNYGDGFQSYEKEEALKAYSSYSNEVNGSISKIKEAGDFKGDTILQHYSLELLGFYKSSLENEFKPFLNTLKADSFSVEEKQVADSLYGNFTGMQGKYWDRFEWAEKKFDLGNKIEKLVK